MNDKKEKLEEDILTIAIKNLDKRFGKGIVQLSSKFRIDDPIEVFSTRSLLLDKALGIGGIPRGRITEIFGSNSSGKTSLTLNIIADAQNKGQKCVFIDAEHALDLGWAKNLGVDLDKLYISQPSCAEEALDIAEELIRSNSIAIVVVDSVSALVPQAEIDGDMSDQQIGLQARIMGKALRKLTGPVAQSNVSLIFVNQIRSNINAYLGGGDVTSGGNALKFYTSIRLELKKIKQIKVGTNTVGDTIRAKVVKNKLASPFKICELSLMYGIGFSLIDEIIDELMRGNIITREGAWFKMDGKVLGQGRGAVKEYIQTTDGELQRLLELAKSTVVLEGSEMPTDE
jgi:recombination protein RecA